MAKNNLRHIKGLPETPYQRGSPADNKHGVKRYNLALPEGLYGELQSLAESEHTTVLDLIRRFIKLGLLVAQIEKDSGAKIVIHEGTRQREIVFFA